MRSSILHPGRIRQLEPKRGTRNKRESRTDVISNTDHKVDAVHEIINKQLAPRIAKKSANAIKSDRREYVYFKKKHTGRRCSCFEDESSAQSDCPICFGEGIVGGFDKFGTTTEVVDATYPGLFLYNIEPTFTSNPRPLYFKLVDEAEEGYLEFDLPISRDAIEMDHYVVGQPKFNSSTKIEVLSPQYKLINEMRDFNGFLGEDSIRVRITLTNQEERPWFSHFYFRYKIADTTIVIGDQANNIVEPSLDQFGIFDAFAEIPIMFADRHLEIYDTEDILYRVQDGQRLKIVTAHRKLVSQTLTSVDVEARFLIPNVDVGAFKIPV